MENRKFDKRHAAGNLSNEFAREDLIPGKEVSFKAVAITVDYDDVRDRSYVEDYEIEDVKVDGVPAREIDTADIDVRVHADKVINDEVLEKLDEALAESRAEDFGPDPDDRGQDE